MLDLIILTQSVQVEKSGGTDTGNQTTENRLRSLVILPTLHPDHLRFLNEETDFYKVIIDYKVVKLLFDIIKVTCI